MLPRTPIIRMITIIVAYDTGIITVKSLSVEASPFNEVVKPMLVTET
jgi:hypothetical protein